MTRLIVLFVCLLPAVAQAQNVTTFHQSGVGFLAAGEDGRMSERHVRFGKGKLGSGVHIRWTLLKADLEQPLLRNCNRMTSISLLLEQSKLTFDEFKREAERGMQVWSAVADITFEYVEHESDADIKIGALAEFDGWAFADVVFGGTAKNEWFDASSICLNPWRQWSVDDEAKSYCVRHTIAHEVGHALGLDHPGSSRLSALMRHRYDRCYAELNEHEIAAVQRLYGKRKLPPSG